MQLQLVATLRHAIVINNYQKHWRQSAISAKFCSMFQFPVNFYDFIDSKMQRNEHAVNSDHADIPLRVMSFSECMKRSYPDDEIDIKTIS